MFLASGGILAPDFGLLAWTTIIFVIFWAMIYRFAGGPIKDALGTRNAGIQDALDEAEKAKNEMQVLRAENEKLIAEAKEEQARIIKEAKAAKEAIIEEAKQKATEEADRIIANANLEIENQKKAAVAEVKNESSLIALAIAERVIKRQLGKGEDQEKLNEELIDEIKLN